MQAVTIHLQFGAELREGCTVVSRALGYQEERGTAEGARVCLGYGVKLPYNVVKHTARLERPAALTSL